MERTGRERGRGTGRGGALGQQTCDGDGDGPAEAGEHGVQTNDHDCMRLTRGLRPTAVATAPAPRPSISASRHNPPHLITLRPPFSNEQGLLNSLPKLRTVTQQELHTSISLMVRGR